MCWNTDDTLSDLFVFFVLISPNLGEPILVKFTEEMQKLGIDKLILDPHL